MAFRIEDHKLGDLYTIDTVYGPPMLGAECACHNPDGNGDGRMDFTGMTLAEIAFEWLEHINDLANEVEWHPRPRVGQMAIFKSFWLDPRKVVEVSDDGSLIKLQLLTRVTNWLPALNYIFTNLGN